MFPGQGAQGGANRPPWQQGQGFNGGGRGNGPPPAKRSRSGPGPVITYYPPPPGYTGPARPPGPYQQPGWPQQQPQPPQQFNYGQAAHPGYQNQAYGAAQPYQQPSYPAPYAASQPPNHAGYPYNQRTNYSAYYPPAGYNNMTQQWSGGAQQHPPNAQQYNATAYQNNTGVHHNNTAHQRNASLQSNSSTHQYGSGPSQTNGPIFDSNGSMPPPNTAFSPPAPFPQPGPTLPPWQQQNHNFSTPSSYQTQPRHNSAPSLSGAGHFNASPDDNDDALSSDLNFFSKEADELETPYYGAECPYARSQHEIDPDLSLGEIIYRPALPTLRPLPATAAQAELEAIAPRIPQPTDHESISEYFINSRRETSLLNVRQTDRWEGVRNDPVFRTFSAIPTAFIPPAEIQAKWRDRPDLNWTERVESPTPEPEPAKPSNTSQEPDILNNLEEALENSSSSFDNPNTHPMDRPRALGGVARDQAQEDILASLGVSGSPKMVYQTPGPAYSRNNSISGHQNGPRGSISHPLPPPPPPPGHPPNGHHRRQSRGDCTANDRAGSTGLRSHHRRSTSVSSNHTATGSDFGSENERITTERPVTGTSGTEDPDRTPRAPLRAENRKRAFEDGDEGGAAGDSGAEDSTPRPGRKAARISK